jgi:hypothetical protein
MDDKTFLAQAGKNKLFAAMIIQDSDVKRTTVIVWNYLFNHFLDANGHSPTL